MSHKFDAAKHTWSYATGELGYVERRRGRGIKLLGIAIALAVAVGVLYVAVWAQ